MTIDSIAHALTMYVHAPLGGVALIAGGIALAVKKGNSVHLKAGRVFYYAMLLSALAAFAISVMPEHENPFLFCIGLFSSYFLISGLRSLKLKQEKVNDVLPWMWNWFLPGILGSVYISYWTRKVSPKKA
jgi:uncharacterized membrane protein